MTRDEHELHSGNIYIGGGAGGMKPMRDESCLARKYNVEIRFVATRRDQRISNRA